jgi:myo-inositol-1(or 4)-monophosphatase
MSASENFTAVAEKAARVAGEVILENLGGLSMDDIGSKQTADFVTRVDRESEERIIGVLRSAFPGHGIFSEESLKEEERGGYRWVIDPLDGTTNYIHGYPVFAVSIALEKIGEPVLGVILDPVRDELFSAEKAGGAFLNGSPIRVSGICSMENSLVATGFPFRRKEMLDIYLRAFKRVFMRVSGMRRAGSAALDLAYLAAGRCEGFFELGLSPWDIAAGSLIVKEAGGVVTDFRGNGEYLSTGDIVAGNPAAHRELLKEIEGVFSGMVEKQ